MDNVASLEAVETNSNIKYRIKYRMYLIIKRIFDIVCAFIGCLFLLPVAIIVKISYILNKDYDSIFFKQQRIGKDGKLFNFYKFRSMVPNADEVLFKLLETDEEAAKEYKINKKL